MDMIEHIGRKPYRAPKLIKVILTEHDKSEFSRMAQAAYASGHNSVGHRFSVAAAIQNDGYVSIQKFDALMDQYRAWLVFDEYTD